MTPKFTTFTGTAKIETLADKRSTIKFLWDSLWKGQLDYAPPACSVILDITVALHNCSLIKGDTVLGYNNSLWFVGEADPPVGPVQKVQLLNVHIHKFEYDIAPGSIWYLFSAPAGEGEITPKSLINSLNKSL